MQKMPAVEQRRLAWRCRRGMLELEIVLQGFVAQYAAQLDAQEVAELERLLDLPDQTFWGLIQGSVLPQNTQTVQLVRKLKTIDYHNGAALI